jgi:hypothetical protein
LVTIRPLTRPEAKIKAIEVRIGERIDEYLPTRETEMRPSARA